MRFGEILVTSLYKFSNYPALLFVKKFKTFLYMMFLVIIMLAGVAVPAYVVFRTDGPFIKTVENDFPDFKTEDGELTCENKKFDQAGIYLEVDTDKTGLIDLPKGYSQAMMISKTHINMKNNGNIQQLKFSDYPDFSKDSLISLYKKYMMPVFWFLVLMLFIVFVISFSVSVAIYSFIAFVVDKIFIHSVLNYWAIYKLGIFSMTFSVIMNMITSMIGLRSFGTIAPLITLFYLIKGILSCKNNNGIIIEEFDVPEDDLTENDVQE